MMRTKHPRVRMHLVKEAVDEDKLEMKYCKAHDMKTDGFFKPIVGAAFKLFFVCMLGRHNSTGRWALSGLS